MAYDSAGQLIRRSKTGLKPGNVTATLTTEYIRDRLGRITTIKDPLLNQWTYTFDELSRRKQVQDPDLGSWSYQYDAASRLTSQTDARGLQSNLTYDVMNRVKTKNVSGSGVNSEITTYYYDLFHAAVPASANAGQLTDITHDVYNIGGGSIQYTHTREFDYDTSGRMVRDALLNIAGQTRGTSYEYYPDGSLRRKQLPDANWTGVHAYDTGGRLYSIDNANPTSANEPDWYVSSVLYNARGQVTQMEKGDFVRSTYAYSAPRGD